MIKMLSLTMIFFSTVMISLNQPLTLGLFILVQTVLICLVTRTLTSSSWIALSLFLVMVGGLMVIFTYVNSVCSNSKFALFNAKQIPLYLITPFIIIFNQSYLFSFNDTLQLKSLYNFEFLKLFLPLNLPSSMFMFIYLLIALMIMVNLTSTNKGPLRKKY
uniref:NADH dehydrogenase subunit 6 n=1 Tax=Paratrioza sinica TaxID=1511640 RepID=A0A068F122_9HEMI|nr:NADH dehydrogenase subunit 6 [Paratrioza sinica]AID54947.1 NADH dehydrogenase subunit 6 [Paratrioza sinica]